MRPVYKNPMINYVSTRGINEEPQTFEDVLLTGLAPDGGLYVPATLPHFDHEDLVVLKGKSYVEVAEAVMYPFVEGCIPRDTFRQILEETYGQKHFRSFDVVPLHKLYDNFYALELFHGPTIAFKDVALQLLGRLFDYVLSKRGEHVTVVGATSGDTGSAAIEGCRHSRHVDIFILHPHGRVSDVQRKQMTTVKEPNVHNIALEGNFDDCQNAVKDMFNDMTFRRQMNLSAINSINWARVMAQIVYYFTAALKLGAPEKEVSFVVPTGNFGNVYAAHVARSMGLQINTLGIATNKNDILKRFFDSGEMKMQGVDPSLSPSMDIQISSNFERYLFEALGRDARKVAELMQTFKTAGSFFLPPQVMQKLREDFVAFRTDEEGTLETIAHVYRDMGYILDPHTAVGVAGALQLAKKVTGPVVSLACAHPAKFPDAVEKAIGIRPDLPAHLSGLFDREEYVDVLPNDIQTLKDFVRNHAQKKAA